jgi:hypothetical protein
VGAAAPGAAAGLGLEARQHADLDLASFRSPSGNIRCEFSPNPGQGRVDCLTLSPPRGARPSPASAVAGAGPILRFGQTARQGRLRCGSAENGITCRDVWTNRGFRIAREGVVLLPNPRRTPPPPPGGGGRCDPNYAGQCVPPYPPDIDCSDLPGPVRVVGSDPLNLDRDGDGVLRAGVTPVRRSVEVEILRTESAAESFLRPLPLRGFSDGAKRSTLEPSTPT